MAGKTRKVIFARINRRQPGQETVAMRAFAEDMTALANSHLTRYRHRANGIRPTRTWFAADMTVVPSGDFLTGTLGYSELQEHREFDEDTWSWVKGATHHADAGSEQTVVPFAVDLREHERWVCFATSGRLQAHAFLFGMKQVLNQAVLDAGLIPTEWEVDLITSRASIDEWLEENPRVHFLRRTIKFTNPGRNLNDDRQEMRNLAAQRKTDEFAAHYKQTLNTNTDEFRSKLVGTETGDLDLLMKARGAHGARVVTFDSRDRPDQDFVDDFANDLERGMEIVLAALREYAASRRKAEPQPGADGNQEPLQRLNGDRDPQDDPDDDLDPVRYD